MEILYDDRARKGAEGISEQTYSISHILREWRNLIHSGRSSSQALEPKPHQAVAGLEFMLSLLNDLNRYCDSGRQYRQGRLQRS